MATLTNINKNSASLSSVSKNGQEIQFIAENGDTYLVGTSETLTLVTQDLALLSNITKN